MRPCSIAVRRVSREVTLMSEFALFASDLMPRLGQEHPILSRLNPNHRQSSSSRCVSPRRVFAR